MRPHLAPAIERVARLRGEATGRIDSAAALAEIENVLCEGYALALTGDAWSSRTEQRLHELISDASVPGRGRELRALGGEHARCRQELIALRSELAELRREHTRLLTASRAASV